MSMSKSKSSSLSLSSCHCAVCAKPINDATEDSIFCEGVCKDWMHRACAGLSKAAFESALSPQMTISAISVIINA